MKKNSVKYIAKVGILSAVAFVVMLIEIPLWFAPGFYKLDFSEVVAMLGGFSLGPAAAVAIELIKNILHIVIRGTSTACVGEMANFVTSCLLILPSAFLYRHRKNFRSALLGMGLGTLLLAVGGALINYYIMIPFYVNAFGVSIDAIVSMGTAVNAHVSDLRTLILWAVVPFNLCKGILTATGCLLLYKRLSPLLHK